MVGLPDLQKFWLSRFLDHHHMAHKHIKTNGIFLTIKSFSVIDQNQKLWIQMYLKQMLSLIFRLLFAFLLILLNHFEMISKHRFIQRYYTNIYFFDYQYDRYVSMNISLVDIMILEQYSDLYTVFSQINVMFNTSIKGYKNC